MMHGGPALAQWSYWLWQRDWSALTHAVAGIALGRPVVMADDYVFSDSPAPKRKRKKGKGF